jgi:hypothetical protein
MCLLEERFLQAVDKIEGGCWLWKGNQTSNGYSVFPITESFTIHAYRFAYAAWKGEIPRRMCVMHSCDNRLCVNPEHLRLGTHKENTQDALSKGRMALGEANGKSKATEAMVHAIRADYKGPQYGELARLCRRYGLAPTTIKKIVTGVTWKHVLPSVRPR